MKKQKDYQNCKETIEWLPFYESKNMLSKLYQLRIIDILKVKPMDPFEDQFNSYQSNPNKMNNNQVTQQRQPQKQQQAQSPYQQEIHISTNASEVLPKQPPQPEEQTGITRFIKQKYYEQYFQVNETQVQERIRATLMAYNDDFLNKIKPNPDFYGPFWIVTTIIFLLGSIGNISTYILSKFMDGPAWDGYLFKLELVRYALILMYSFGLGVPVTLYFIFKFLRPDGASEKITLPEMICLYGYSLSCYIFSITLCIIPVGFLQWIFLIFGFVNSSIFLVASLQKHIEGIKAKKVIICCLIAGIQILLMLCIKFIFLNVMASEEVAIDQPITND